MTMLRLIVLLLLSTPIYAASDLEKKDFYLSLRCLVCSGQTIYDSDAEFSQDIKLETERMLSEGKTLKEIKDFFVGMYGEEILLSPPLKGNLIIWSMPYTIALLLIFYLYRKRYGESS